MAKTKVRFILKYKCRMCGEGFSKKYNAESCEQKHRDKQDLYFSDYEHFEEMQKLKGIASDKKQKKLEMLK